MIVGHTSNTHCFYSRAQSLDRRDPCVMGKRPWGSETFDNSIKAGRLENSDQNWTRSVAFKFTKDEYLLIMDFGNYDPFELYLNFSIKAGARTRGFRLIGFAQ